MPLMTAFLTENVTQVLHLVVKRSRVDEEMWKEKCRKTNGGGFPQRVKMSVMNTYRNRIIYLKIY